MAENQGKKTDKNYMVWVAAGSGAVAVSVAALVFTLRSQFSIQSFPVPLVGDGRAGISASLLDSGAGGGGIDYILDAREKADVLPDINTVVKVPDSVGTIPLPALIHPAYRNISFFIYVYDGKENERTSSGKDAFRANRFWYSDGYLARNKDKQLQSYKLDVHGGDFLYVFVNGGTLPENYESVPIYFSAYRASGAQGGRRRIKETICGNGVMEGFEECDDGNNDAGDGCSGICKVEVAGE